MDLFLKLYSLFQTFIFKNVRNTVDYYQHVKKWAFKANSTPAVGSHFGI